MSVQPFQPALDDDLCRRCGGTKPEHLGYFSVAPYAARNGHPEAEFADKEPGLYCRTGE